LIIKLLADEKFHVNNDNYNNVLINELKIFQTALNEASLVSLTDINGTILFVNKKFCETSKYSKLELIGENHRILKSGHHPKSFYTNIWKVISSGRIWRGNIKNKAKDGTYYWVKTVIMPILDSNKKIVQHISIRTDITKEIKLQLEVKKSHSELFKMHEELKQKSVESTHRYILQRQLTKSTADLQSEKKFNAEKEEFAAMVSHELKTPIFPIKMHCEMLKDPSMMGTLNPEQLESVNMIEKMVLDLERLTGDIFDAQKLEMRQMQFNKTSFKLCEFFKDVKKDIQPLLIEKNILLTTDFDDIKITTDRERLSQIFSNLLRNSIDFVASKTGEINIGCIEKHDRTVFFVRDNGIGIPKNKIKGLFRKFYQIDTSLKRRHGGTGLGLVICKGIVERLGGKIWVYSEVAKGTTFSFDIPYESQHNHNYITDVRNPLLLDNF